MGLLTLADFRAETRFNLKNRNDSGVTDTRIDRWINAAMLHMGLPSVHRFRELQRTYDITLVLDTNSYSLSQATIGFKLLAPRSVYNIIEVPETPTSRKRRLSPRNIHWFDRRTLSSGIPSNYALDGETLFISGVPSATEAGQIVRVRYWSEPSPLTLVTDTTPYATYYDEVLVIGAQWVAERTLGYRDRAEMTKQDYIGLLNEGPEQEELEAEDWSFQVDINPNAQSEMMT
jgi:hypothetical protein